MAQNRLAIIPDQTHYDIFMSPVLVSTILPFVDGKRSTHTWDEHVANVR